MKKFMDEFKEFALRGNVMSLAVGMIIGLAFQEVVSSLTDNILSPIIGLLVGQNFDFLQLHILGVTLYYGAFLTSVLNFVVMALVVFLIVRSMNKLLDESKSEETPEEPKRTCPFCMVEVHLEAKRCAGCTSEL